MGQSTDGQICYGISFADEFEFPWDTTPFDGDLDEWWQSVNGYKPPFEIYDDKGGHIGGIAPPREKVDEYFNHLSAWKDAHPLPVELVNTCSGDYPQYILAVPATTLSANRGYPQKFLPGALAVALEDSAALIQFCVTHNIVYEEEQVGWWLSSYWG